MNAAAQLHFLELCSQLAQGYGVEDVSKQFAVTPVAEQRLQDKIVEQSKFLGKINVLGVDEIMGEVVLGSASGPATGRTDTDEEDKERKPVDLVGLEKNGYELKATESDVSIKYKTIDAWAKFPDFLERYGRYVQQRIASDRELIGWFGEQAAATTNRTTNPLLQDVNIGWMQIMRARKSGNILTEGKKQPGEIRIGAGGDYFNLDHVVSDLLLGIPEHLREGVVALIGSELVGKEKATLFKTIGEKPTEKTLAHAAMDNFGSLDWETPTNFPARGLVLTSLDNLSIYHQSGSWRRQVLENPKKNRVEDYNSRNEGYVVEELEKFVALEFKNVKMLDATGAWK